MSLKGDAERRNESPLMNVSSYSPSSGYGTHLRTRHKPDNLFPSVTRAGTCLSVRGSFNATTEVWSGGGVCAKNRLSGERRAEWKNREWSSQVLQRLSNTIFLKGELITL